jgi:hypothetical protein
MVFMVATTPLLHLSSCRLSDPPPLLCQERRPVANLPIYLNWSAAVNPPSNSSDHPPETGRLITIIWRRLWLQSNKTDLLIYPRMEGKLQDLYVSFILCRCRCKESLVPFLLTVGRLYLFFFGSLFRQRMDAWWLAMRTSACAASRSQFGPAYSLQDLQVPDRSPIQKEAQNQIKFPFAVCCLCF